MSSQAGGEAGAVSEPASLPAPVFEALSSAVVADEFPGLDPSLPGPPLPLRLFASRLRSRRLFWAGL